ncbi:hypothetical protein BDP27DRAFT_1365385 [Rhodocollybia butyracea]|uniref:Nuclear transport factor 2 domain-containing protein n=1 Tax=Rhodocollybia butyracea TaxID=206335 RepID=A0A9P5PRN5_9AGAR|nr:hypothetical protein BDP27DRAFT_1365385 [Rhodocollybia butyracea]
MCVDWERRKSVGGDAKPSLGSVRNIGKGKQKEILETERNENLIDQLAAARGAISSHSPDVAPLARESPSSSPPCTAIPSPAQKQVEPRPPQLIDSEHNVNPHTGTDEVNLLLQSFEVLRRTLIAIKNESSPIHNDPSSLTTADPPLHSLPSSPPVLAISPPASRPSPTPSPSPMKLQESNFDFGTRGDADMIIDLTQDDVEPARIDSTASYAHPRPPDNSPPADDDSQPRSRYDPPLLVRLGSGSRSVGPSSLRPQTQTQNIQETHGQPASGAFTNSSSLISSYLDNTASTNKITPMPTPSPPHLSDPRLDTAGPSSRDLHSVESKSKVVPMPHPLTPTHTPPPPTSMFDFHDISTVVIVGDIEDVEDETGRKKSGTSTRGKRGAMMVTQLERPPQLKDEVQSRESQTRMGDSDPLDVCQAIDEDGDIGHPPVQPSDDDFRSSSYERNSSSPIQSIWFVDPSANNSNVQPIARGKEVVDQSRNQIEMNEVASGMKGYDVNVENDVEGEMEADSMDEKSEMEALAVEFLRRYINAWEYNRHSLVNAYAPSAVFSCSVIVPNTIPSTSSSSNSRASPSNSSSRSTPNLSPTLEFASHFVTSTALSSSFPSSSSSGIYSTSRTLNRPPLPIQTPAVISPALLLLDPQRLYTFFPRGEKAEIAYDSLWLGEAGAGGGLVYLGVQAELDRQTRTLANVNMNGEKVCISWNFVLRRTFMDDIEHGGGSGNAQGSEDDEIQFPLLVVSHQMVVRDTC